MVRVAVTLTSLTYRDGTETQGEIVCKIRLTREHLEGWAPAAALAREIDDDGRTYLVADGFAYQTGGVRLRR